MSHHLAHLLYARPAGNPDAPNVPIAVGIENKLRFNDEPQMSMRWLPMTTTTGRRIEIRRADCGAGCRCAAEWREVAS